MSRETVLDKVRKLLALAESDNPHEAALAAAKAQALMEEHAIATADLGEAGADEAIGEGELWAAPGSTLPAWRGALASALAKVGGCMVYRHGGRLQLVGRPSDVEAVRVLFGLLAAEVERLTARLGRGRGRSFAHSFRLGVVIQIRREVEAAQRETRERMRGTVTSSALVVVDRRAREAQVHAQQAHHLGRSGYRSSVRGGYREGQQAGAGAYGRAASGKLGGGQRQLRG